jgi:ABC-type tungstate transport system substrate-binding protein
MNALMGLPPVVAGLKIFLLSRSGPLGPFGLLFTPAALKAIPAILAQDMLTIERYTRAFEGEALYRASAAPSIVT